MKIEPRYVLMGAAFIISGIANLCTEKMHHIEMQDEVNKVVAEAMKNFKK